MARVTKDTTIGEVIQIDAGVIPIITANIVNLTANKAMQVCTVLDVLHQQERH